MLSERGGRGIACAGSTHQAQTSEIKEQPPPVMGALDGGSQMSHVEFKKMAMSQVSVAYCPQCHMSNLRNEYVPCHYIFSLHVACH